MHNPKQLDCTISIASSKINRIDGIHFGQPMMFNRFNYVTNIQKYDWINICDMDWKGSISNNFDQPMPCESSLLNSISGWVMILKFSIIHLSSEHRTTGIFLQSILFLFTLLQFLMPQHCKSACHRTQGITKYVVRFTDVIGGGMHKSNFQPV
jgi:hypothetical protein